MLDGSTFSRELWRFSVLIGTWAQELAAGPAAAHGSRMVAVGRKLYVFGGAPALDARMWVFDTLAGTWSSIASIYAGRSYHTMTRVDTGLFIYGGAASLTAALPQLLKFDLSADAFNAPTTSGAEPSIRIEHSMAPYFTHLYLFGGILLLDGSFDSAVYELDCTSLTWRAMATTGLRLRGRRGHTASVMGCSMYIFGGVDADGHYQNSVYILDLRSFQWSKPLAIGTPPAARWGCCGPRRTLWPI